MNTMHVVTNRRLASNVTKKLIYPAADRNKDPILDILKQIIHPGPNQIFLEIASGTGQHITHFAPNFPQITFYPSEHANYLLESISNYVNGFTNIHEPVLIDASTDCKMWNNGFFKNSSIDYIYCANMIHVSPYQCTVGLFKNAGYLLKPQGTLITYGAYAVNGKIEPESNVQFNQEIQKQNPSWGLRDIKDLEILARDNGITLEKTFDMPANNKTLIWKKKPTEQ